MNAYIANGELVVEVVAIHSLSSFTLACFASIAIGWKMDESLLGLNRWRLQLQ
ncbi:hypothetical protein [Ectopseudomonas oleovorans]|uniref:hypothetical protein n=1 Tax=Ectopseudomonas oleovorans TaxID=301 RepID=UPI00142D7BE4|nr:hypothetical protein [Pseudomonas indoloxydans]